MWDSDLHLDYVVDGSEYNHIIGQTDGHGKWFSWNLAWTNRWRKIIPRVIVDGMIKVI